MPKRLKLSGRRFGRLVAIKDIGKSANGNRLWLCHCDCGNKYSVRGSNLVLSGHTQSCGCIRGRKRGEAAFNTLCSKMKNSAKKRGYMWNLTNGQIRKITKKECFYCGSPPKQIVKNRAGNGDYLYNGIDRVDNKKGYISSNIVPCCGQCNQSKSNLSLTDFTNWIRAVYLKMIERKECDE